MIFKLTRFHPNGKLALKSNFNDDFGKARELIVSCSAFEVITS
ncbi:MAG: hypothetical protein AAF551_15225 [Bacteroidota bacterium]